MKIQNDGGPAFPQGVAGVPGGHICSYDYADGAGMSLRDYYAGMALMGLAVNQETLLANKELMEHFGTYGIDKLQANKAWRLADAMMVERARGKIGVDSGGAGG